MFTRPVNKIRKIILIKCFFKIIHLIHTSKHLSDSDLLPCGPVIVKATADTAGWSDGAAVLAAVGVMAEMAGRQLAKLPPRLKTIFEPPT